MLSPQQAPRHTSRRRLIPMPASPRHRARCDRHEARVRIVALMSCCLARLSNGGSGPPDETALSSPACTQRSTCRGAALGSHSDPLVPSGDERRRSKALFFNVLYGASIADSDFCNLENPCAPGHCSSLCAVTQQQWCGCVQRMLVRFHRTCFWTRLLPDWNAFNCLWNHQCR